MTVVDQPDGSPCEENETCKSGFCITEQISGWAGGYCSSPCNEIAQTCVSPGSTCVNVSPQAGLWFCLKDCTSGGSECTATQKCTDLFGDGSALVCAGDACTMNEQCTHYEICKLGLCAPACGDGLTAKPEECDDGNLEDTDTCSNACELNPVAEAEPNDSAALAQEVLQKDILLSGQLGGGDVEDWARVTVQTPGSTLIAGTQGDAVSTCGPAGLIDTAIQILKEDGTTILAENDDMGFNNYCSAAQVSGLDAGLYHVRVTRSPLCPDCAFSYGVTIHVIQ